MNYFIEDRSFKKRKLWIFLNSTAWYIHIQFISRLYKYEACFIACTILLGNRGSLVTRETCHDCVEIPLELRQISLIKRKILLRVHFGRTSLESSMSQTRARILNDLVKSRPTRCNRSREELQFDRVLGKCVSSYFTGSSRGCLWVRDQIIRV